MSRMALSVLAIILLAACEPTNYNLECGVQNDGEMSSEECTAVAARVVDVKPAVPGHQLGDLQTVSVELLGCTAEEARGLFMSELAAPDADRCWVVVLSYGGGDLSRVAMRHVPSGELTVH
jgi:hypothetical protein